MDIINALTNVRLIGNKQDKRSNFEREIVLFVLGDAFIDLSMLWEGGRDGWTFFFGLKMNIHVIFCVMDMAHLEDTLRDCRCSS